MTSQTNNEYNGKSTLISFVCEIIHHAISPTIPNQETRVSMYSCFTLIRNCQQYTFSAPRSGTKTRGLRLWIELFNHGTSWSRVPGTQ